MLQGGTKHFTTTVNFQEVRGYQMVIPRPVAANLGKPERVTFSLKTGKFEFRAVRKQESAAGHNAEVV